MKKILLVAGAILLGTSLAHAAYTAENKVIKVVMPQSSSSGLASIYNHIEAYARKQNINMIPVFKPGANSKIGFNYASEQKNNGNTLLFSTLSDFVETANDADFDKVAPITKTSLVLVASPKSNIKSITDIVAKERSTPGKLTWAYVSSAQLILVNGVIKASNLDTDKVYKVPYSIGHGFQTSLVNGDADLGFVLPKTAEALSVAGRVTIVNIDEKTKQAILKKENGTALFLPKNSSVDANMFWNKFVKGLENDAEFKQALKSLRIDTYKNTDSVELERVIADWKM
jgi:tripartite-type tricarboxylate transporter receptor subunit TctC